MKFRVFVSYPMSAFGSVDEGLLATDAKKFGGREWGSGAGLGRRDLDYGDFTDENKAEDFAMHARGIHKEADAWVEFDEDSELDWGDDYDE